MDIKSSTQKLIDPYANQVQKKGQEIEQRGQEGQQVGVKGDRVSVSPQAKLFTEAYTTAMNTSELRQDKIDSLKEQVQNGSYEINAKKTAENLLKSDIEIGKSLGS